MNKKRIAIFILIVIWAILVFSMSNQNGEESGGLSRKVTEIFFHTEEHVNIVEPYVRKLAHFSEYAVGGMLFFALFLTYELSDKKRIIFSFCIGTWYSIIDEIHQSFIPERSASPKDVYIDSLGVLFGILILLLIIKIIKRKRERQIRN